MSIPIDTPAQIQLLLYFFCYQETRHPDFEMDGIQYTLKRFLEWEVVERVYELEDVYRTTPLGAAWVQALCRVQCPRIAFVDERNEVLSYLNDD